MERHKLPSAFSGEFMRVCRGVCVVLCVCVGVYAYMSFMHSESGSPQLTPIALKRKLVAADPPPGYVLPGGAQAPSTWATPPVLKHVCVSGGTSSGGTTSAATLPRQFTQSLQLFKHDPPDAIADDASVLGQLVKVCHSIRPGDLIMVTPSDAVVSATEREIVESYLTATLTAKKRGILVSAKGMPASSSTPMMNGAVGAVGTSGSQQLRATRPDGRAFVGRSSTIEAALQLAAANGIKTYSGFVDLLRKLASGDTENVEAIGNISPDSVPVTVDVDGMVFLSMEGENPQHALEFDPAFQRWKQKNKEAYFCIALMGHDGIGSSASEELLRMLRGEACSTCMLHHPWLSSFIMVFAALCGLFVGVRGWVTLWMAAGFFYALIDPIICMLYVPCARACSRDNREEVKAT